MNKVTENNNKISLKTATSSEFDICRTFDKYNDDAVLVEKIDRGFVTLAMTDLDTVGYLRWDWFWNRHPYLCLIVVQKKHRAQGIGSMLISDWQSKLKQEGLKFCLSSSQENEPPAVQWHLKQGFREIGRIESLNEDGSTELFLRKDL